MSSIDSSISCRVGTTLVFTWRPRASRSPAIMHAPRKTRQPLSADRDSSQLVICQMWFMKWDSTTRIGWALPMTARSSDGRRA